jgi:hypothetical protein
MISVTVPAGYTTDTPGNTPSGAGSNGAGLVAAKPTAAISYVFDAVLSAEHEQSLTKTNHPVQTGASVSSHAYIEPAELVLYVLMSDVTPQYATSNQSSAPYVQQWTGNPSKSVAAYQQMLALQAARIPLTVTTRLRTYSNMLVCRVAPREDEKTTTGARFRVEFGQVFVANIQLSPLSARPNDTQTTGLGSVNPAPVPATVQNQFGVEAFGPGGPNPAPPLPPDLNNGSKPVVDNGVPGYLYNTQPGFPPTFVPQYPNSVNAVDVPGAGAYTSSNYNSLPAIGR